MSKLRSFKLLSWRRKSMLFQLAFFSIYGFIVLRFFKKKSRFGKVDSNVTFWKGEQQILLDIRAVIRLLDKYLPWENVCRHQALQAAYLLKKYKVPYQIFTGAKLNEDGKVDAHAWTMVNNFFITGICKPEEYKIIAIFSG